MNKVYILYSCNEWKEYSSMSIIGVFSSWEKVKKVVMKEIEDDNIEWNGYRRLAEIDNIRDLNTAITYGHVEEHIVDEED